MRTVAIVVASALGALAWYYLVAKVIVWAVLSALE